MSSLWASAHPPPPAQPDVLVRVALRAAAQGILIIEKIVGNSLVRCREEAF